MTKRDPDKITYSASSGTYGNRPPPKSRKDYPTGFRSMFRAGEDPEP